MTETTVTPQTLLRWQQEQFQHDRRNHTDIICLSRTDRLKHYGLHYAKYVGRVAIARDQDDVMRKTIVDAVLVFLSAANVLSQRLDEIHPPLEGAQFSLGMLEDIADASGRFCDACEKIDHFEDFLAIARSSNIDVLQWILAVSVQKRFDLEALIVERRGQLAQRQFLIPTGS